MRWIWALWAVAFAVSAAEVKQEVVGVTHLPAETVTAGFAKGVNLAKAANYRVEASRRDVAGEVEVHTKDTDIFYVTSGSATFVTGGTLVGGREIAPDEIRGKDVTGGAARHLAKGDVIIVPAGTPHWFKEIQEPSTYFVVKVR